MLLRVSLLPFLDAADPSPSSDPRILSVGLPCLGKQKRRVSELNLHGGNRLQCAHTNDVRMLMGYRCCPLRRR